MNTQIKIIALTCLFVSLESVGMRRTKKRTATQAFAKEKQQARKKQKTDKELAEPEDQKAKPVLTIKAPEYTISSVPNDNLTEGKIIRENVSSDRGPLEVIEGRRHETAFAFRMCHSDPKKIIIKDKQTQIEYQFVSKTKVTCLVEWLDRMVVVGGDTGALELYDFKEIAKAHRYTVGVHTSAIKSLLVWADGRLISKSVENARYVLAYEKLVSSS